MVEGMLDSPCGDEDQYDDQNDIAIPRETKPEDEGIDALVLLSREKTRLPDASGQNGWRGLTAAASDVR